MRMADPDAAVRCERGHTGGGAVLPRGAHRDVREFRLRLPSGAHKIPLASENAERPGFWYV
ncbi:hypothetical protein GCM10025787_26840 [Saccharopolyspora rosea]